MRVFNPLPSDHPLVTGCARCVLCGARFVAGDRTTLLVPAVEEPGNYPALPVHASCVSLALAGVCELPHEVELDHDPGLPPEQRALQRRYEQAVALMMVSEMDPEQPGCCIAMINALLSNALLGLRVLNRTGAIKPGGLARVVERIKLALELT